MKLLLLWPLLGCSLVAPLEGPAPKALLPAPMALGPSPGPPARPKALAQYCQLMEESFRRYGWGPSRCASTPWNHVRDSFLGRPLVWATFGPELPLDFGGKEQNRTLILCGVHGDEITPVKFCFDLIHHLRGIKAPWKNELVAVAPLVTPDGFFRKRPTRTNYRGVDVNRNLPTKDWHRDALRLWKNRYKKDPRRYPGPGPMSEHETFFQVNLIKRYQPDKIISVHAPLTILDYDGPEFEKRGPEATILLERMSLMAKGYNIKDYPFFPGSLGNYAGNERGIPTYTLELPSSDYFQHKKYWELFKDPIMLAIFNDFQAERSQCSPRHNCSGRPSFHKMYRATTKKKSERRLR